MQGERGCLGLSIRRHSQDAIGSWARGPFRRSATNVHCQSLVNEVVQEGRSFNREGEATELLKEKTSINYHVSWLNNPICLKCIYEILMFRYSRGRGGNLHGFTKKQSPKNLLMDCELWP